MASYEERIAAEKSFFTGCDVHALPPIFHYWSDTYVRPKFESGGFTGPHDVFHKTLQALCERDGSSQLRFLSIGAGDCALEVGIASRLRELGFENFVIDCLDLNESMLASGMAAAREAGVSAHMTPQAGDFNYWQPEREYDAVLAMHVLHHVVNLEGLYAGIKARLRPEGRFIVADMVGRNGHQRWPEALAIVHEFWRKLPPSYRFNRELSRYEEVYVNHDCAATGFEGIRAQDVLPLLVESFAFEWAIGYGNIVEPFIDRRFGPNFDIASEWDRAFVDAVHARDEFEMARGVVKPTSLCAILMASGESKVDAAAWVRPPDRVLPDPEPLAPHYDWHSWPHSPARELEIVAAKLAECEQVRAELKDWATKQMVEIERLKELLAKERAEFEERTVWALQLDKDVTERTEWALRLERELGVMTGRVIELEAALAAARPGAGSWWRKLRER